MQLKPVNQRATFWTHFNKLETSSMFYHTWGKMLRCRKKASFGLVSQPCVMNEICWICLSLSSGSLFMLILFTLITVSTSTSYPCFLPLFPPALPQQFSIQKTHSFNLWLSTSRNKICFLFTERV